MDKPAIYVDFDGTIAPKFGFNEPPTSGVVESLCNLSTRYKIVIYSTRANPAANCDASQLELLEYLARYHIPYDEISHCKPLFAAIIDDRSFNPQTVEWSTIVDKLMSL